MTQKDKELLLKDLCARLPYSTLCYCKWAKDAPNGTSGCIDEVSTFLLEELVIIDNPKYECQICEIKPYLRSMSSMTEDECKELGDLPATIENVGETLPNIPYYIEVARPEQLDWLNAHHFDYRDLIGKGLAFEALEGMYNLNKE